VHSLRKPADELMVQYAHYHRDRRNIATHVVGIPLIVFSIFLFLTWPLVTLGDAPVTAAWVVWVLGAAWYLSRGQRALGLATAAVTAALCVMAHSTSHWLLAQPDMGAPWVWALGCFVVGWVFQFVGHFWEGKKPAFADDLVGLLVGPMFVVGEVMMALGALSPLRHTIEAQAGPTR
jgi:uncharacterized membrane protein YGL010W